MVLPITVPARSPPSLNHSAAEVTRTRRYAPCSCSVPPCPSRGLAAHGGSGNEDMPVRANACPLSEKRNQSIARGDRIGVRARMPSFAAPVHLPSGDASDPKSRSLCAPNRAVPVPYVGRGACKCLSRRNGRNLQDQVKQGSKHGLAYHASQRTGQVRSLICR